MRSWRRPVARSGATGLICAVLTAGLLLPAAADEARSRTYSGHTYSAEVPRFSSQPESQTRLWFHADAWWGLLLDPTGRTARVHELMPDHTWRPTSAVVNPDAGSIGDALHDGEVVHVVSRRSDNSLQYVRLSFDPAIRDYRTGSSEPVATHPALMAMTAEDTTGRLWVVYTTAVGVFTTYRDAVGASWARPIALSTWDAGESRQTAALAAYEDRIGVLWSDPISGSIEFASHGDSDDPEQWSREQALPGPGYASSLISLVRARGSPSDTLIAAIRSVESHREIDLPLVDVAVRGPDGRWSSVPAGTVGDGLDQPLLQVDEGSRTLHLFASRGPDVVTKRASLDDIRFEPGVGDVFVQGLPSDDELVDPTGTKDPVDPRSGLVVVASDPEGPSYRHAEMPITSSTRTADPADRSPPEPPGDLLGRAVSSDTVVLSWAEATDGDRWAPARSGRPVREYVVRRDAVEVATVTSTSYHDLVPAGPSGRRTSSVEYSVVAVDPSGNSSAPALAVVRLPEVGPASTSRSSGIALLALAMSAAGLAVWRHRRVRAMVNVSRHRRAARRTPQTPVVPPPTQAPGGA